MKVAICYEKPPNVSADLLDVIEQVEFIKKNISHEYSVIPYASDAADFLKNLQDYQPDVIWNLMETVNGSEENQHQAMAFFDMHGFKYTGGGFFPALVANDKYLCKQLLDIAGVPTPPLLKEGVSGGRYIVKPAKLHGSVGIDSTSVMGYDKALKALSASNIEMIAEEYINGREFSLTLLETEKGMSGIVVAEMQFLNSNGDINIIDYKSKWDEESDNYKNSVRTFDFKSTDDLLIKMIKDVGEKAAKVLGLQGFARIDFRTDDRKIPFVIDVNVNPGLGDDAGFCAACLRYGYSYPQMIDIILDAAIKR